MVELHPLKPYLPPNSRLLMLGSFPPPRTRWSMDFFYPNFINDMWRILGLVFKGEKLAFIDTPHKKFKLEAIKELLNQKGIALYDTATEVNRLNNNASDKFLEIITPTDIASLLKQIPLCSAVCATGGKAAEELSRQLNAEVPKTGESTAFTANGQNMKFYRMPSSSRAYPMSVERKAEFYRRMFIETGILPNQS